MKICFFGLELTYKGGVENLSINLIKHLAQNGNVDEIFVICDNIDGEAYRSLPRKKVNVQCLGRVRKSDFIRIFARNLGYRRLSKELDRFNIFHLLDCRAFSLVNLGIRPLVVNIHDVMIHEFLTELKATECGISDYFSNLIPKIDHHLPQLFLEFLSAIKADKIVANTPIVANRLRKLYGDKVCGKIRVIPPGFDPARFNPYIISKSDAKHYLDLTPSSKVLLHVGGCAPRKGLLYLLQALDHMHKMGRLDQPYTLLLVLGKVSRRYLRIFAALREHVIELPYVAEHVLPVVYRAADVFVMPSISEGWGISLIQALACGTPVIASQYVPSAMDTKDTGMVFVEPNVGDPEKLAESLLKVLESASCGATNWNRIFDSLTLKYSWENISRQQLRVYEGLIDNSI